MLLCRVRDRHWRTTDRSMSYVRRTSCPVRAGVMLVYTGTYPASLFTGCHKRKKKYRDLFLPTTEVEDDQWWLGSGSILRTVQPVRFHS